jgi:hypothetical protein
MVNFGVIWSLVIISIFINLNPFTLHLRSIQHHQSITITNNNNTGVRFYSQQSQFFFVQLNSILSNSLPNSSPSCQQTSQRPTIAANITQQYTIFKSSILTSLQSTTEPFHPYLLHSGTHHHNSIGLYIWI